VLHVVMQRLTKQKIMNYITPWRWSTKTETYRSF